MAGGLLGLIAGITGVNKTTGGQTVELPKGAEPSSDAIKLSESDNNVKWYIPEKPVHPFWDALLNRGEIANTADQQNRAIQMALAGIPISGEQQRAIQRGRATGELEGEFGEGNARKVQNLKTKTAETQSEVYSSQARNLLEQLDSLYPYIKMLTKGGAESEMAVNKLKELQANTGIDLTPLLKAKDEGQAQALIEEYKNAILKSQTERGSIPDIINKQNEVLLKNLGIAGTKYDIEGMKLAPEYNFYSTPEAKKSLYDTLSSQQDLTNRQLREAINKSELGNDLTSLSLYRLGKLPTTSRESLADSLLGLNKSLIKVGDGAYYDITSGRFYYNPSGTPDAYKPDITYDTLIKQGISPFRAISLEDILRNAKTNNQNTQSQLAPKPAGKPISINPYPNPYNPYLVR